MYLNSPSSKQVVPGVGSSEESVRRGGLGLVREGKGRGRKRKLGEKRSKGYWYAHEDDLEEWSESESEEDEGEEDMGGDESAVYNNMLGPWDARITLTVSKCTSTEGVNA